MIAANADNISRFFRVIPDVTLKTAISKIAENPYAEKILEKTPIQDMVYIGRKYNKAPEIYDDLFSQKIKFSARSLTKEPIPVFKGENANTLSDILDRNSLLNAVVSLFEIYGTKTDPITTILLGLKENTIKTAFLNKKGKVVMHETLELKNQNTDGDIFKLMKASSNKIVKLTRD